jgi:hypothetical protein
MLLDIVLTQVDVAKRLKKPQPVVSKFETVVRRVDPVELRYRLRCTARRPVIPWSELQSLTPSHLIPTSRHKTLALRTVLY